MSDNDFGGRKSRLLRQDHQDGACNPNSNGYCSCALVEAPIHEADVICSDVRGLFTDGRHKPVIDLDLSCQLIPSGSPGHYHLYIDKEVSFAQYTKILDAMAEAGIVQWGFADTTRERGYGSVRHPDRPKRALPTQDYILSTV